MKKLNVEKMERIEGGHADCLALFAEYSDYTYEYMTADTAADRAMYGGLMMYTGAELYNAGC